MYCALCCTSHSVLLEDERQVEICTALPITPVTWFDAVSAVSGNTQRVAHSSKQITAHNMCMEKAARMTLSAGTRVICTRNQ